MKTQAKPPKKGLTAEEKVACVEVLIGALHSYVGRNLVSSVDKTEILRRLSWALGVLEGKT